MAASRTAWCAAAILLLATQSASAELITGFDVVVAGDLHLQGRIEGRTLVVGDVTTGFPSFGTGLNPASAYSNVDVLVVGGDLRSNGVTMQAGDLRVGGSFGGTSINLNGPGSEKFEFDASAVAQAASLGQQLQTISNAFSSLAADSTWSITNGTTVTFHATPGDDGIAVFNVPASLLTMQNANFLLPTTGLPAATSYVFNVVGQLTSTPMGNFGEGFNNNAVSAYTLWNFAEQESDLLLSREWFGSILLPESSLITSGPVNGGVYVGGDFTSNADVRLPSFAGTAPAATPEPSSMTLVALAGLGMAGARWRKRKTARTAPAPASRSAGL